MSSSKVMKFFGLVVIAVALVVPASFVSSKSIDNKEKDLMTTSMFLKQTFPKESLLAAALLASDDESAVDNNNNYDDEGSLRLALGLSDLYSNSNGRALQEDGASSSSVAQMTPLVSSSSPNPLIQKLTAPLTNMLRGSRTKRSIGFLTRLGACVMTFLSNPSCWQRLTRAQIQREQKRQLDAQQQQMEQQKKFLEQQIYEGYVNTLLYSSNNTSLNDSLTEDGRINGTALALAMTQAIPVPTLPPYTTTSRPRLFPSLGRMSGRLFPRLMSFMDNVTGGMRSGGSADPDSGRTSGYFLSPSSQRNQEPNFRSLFSA